MMIRKAADTDLEAMVGLLSELFTIEDDFTIDLERHKMGLSLLLSHEDAHILVAETEGRVVGMVTMQSLISTVMGSRVGLIEDFIVTESMRSRGIGQKLFDALLALSADLGYTRLALGADSRNSRALSFYRSYGFTSGHMGLMYRLS